MNLAADPTPIGTDVLLQYGVLGVVAVLLLWFAKSTIERERERADRLEEELRRLNNLIADKHVPALEAATRAVAAATALMTEIERGRGP